MLYVIQNSPEIGGATSILDGNICLGNFLRLIYLRRAKYRAWRQRARLGETGDGNARGRLARTAKRGNEGRQRLRDCLYMARLLEHRNYTDH